MVVVRIGVDKNSNNIGKSQTPKFAYNDELANADVSLQNGRSNQNVSQTESFDEEIDKQQEAQLKTG